MESKHKHHIQESEWLLRFREKCGHNGCRRWNFSTPCYKHCKVTLKLFFVFCHGISGGYYFTFNQFKKRKHSSKLLGATHRYLLGKVIGDLDLNSIPITQYDWSLRISIRI